MKKVFKNKSGITLIALVITIIVMLILVGVTINIAVNGGLFEYARKAAKDTELAKNEEKNIANIQDGLSVDELIDTFEDKTVTNPYKNETPKYVWTYKNGSWSNVKDENGEIIASAYEKGKITVEGEEKKAYHLVIEYLKGDGIVENMGDPHDGFIVWHSDLDGYLTKAIVCDGITEIGENVFRGCSTIQEVKMSNTVKKLSESSFSHCKSLKSIKIPSNVEVIGRRAFSYCTGLTDIVIPDSVVTLEGYCFENCSNITNIRLSKNLQSIGDYAFENCIGFKTLEIPDSVTQYSDTAIRGCTGLTYLSAPNVISSSNYQSILNSLPSLKKIKILHNKNNSGEDSIDYYPYSGLTYVTDIIVGDGVTRLKSCFYSCPELHNLTLPKSIKNIEYIGSNSPNLKSINFEGTMNEWESITKNPNWKSQSSLENIICTDGTIAL